MTHLFDVRQKPGRRRTVVAHAKIIRPEKGGPFWSVVSMGDGKPIRRSARTRDRAKALAFCRAHLMECLRGKPDSVPAPAGDAHDELPLFG